MSNKCSASTAKKTPCSNGGKYEVGGKFYCHIHNPNKEKTETVKPAAKKTTSKAAASTPPNDDGLDDADEEALPDTCDISARHGEVYHPDKITNVYIDGKNFMNAEHAYHFLKFWYPAVDNKAKVLEVAKAIYTSHSMASVRTIAEKNSRLKISKWDKLENGVTYSELVMFTILAKSDGSSFRNKVMSITTDFSDSESTVTQYVPHYPAVLKALANYLRRA